MPNVTIRMIILRPPSPPRGYSWQERGYAVRTSVKIWLSLIPGILFVAMLVYLIAERAGGGQGGSDVYIDISTLELSSFPWNLLA